MNYFDYREKLGIGFNDKTKVNYLKNKIINLIKLSMFNSQIQEKYFDENCFYTYFSKIGEAFQPSSTFDYDNIAEYEQLTNSIICEDNITEVIWKFVVLMNVSDCKKQKYLLSFIKDALVDLNIQYEIIKDKDGYFIFPKGAKELDDKLISEPLEWLKDYKLSHKAFIKALRDYSEVDENTASQVADNLRKALETFFQEFFGKNGTLENLKKEYGTYMKGKGVPAELSNNLEALLQAYTNFMNGYAKHHSKTNKNLLEYIMYQTGNIVRLMITLKKEEN